MNFCEVYFAAYTVHYVWDRMEEQIVELLWKMHSVKRNFGPLCICYVVVWLLYCVETLLGYHEIG